MADWTIIGVPSSAGAHHPGQERAPQALRQAGLVLAEVNPTHDGDGSLLARCLDAPVAVLAA